MPHPLDELAVIDSHAAHDPAAVELSITVEEIYMQISKGRALRPSSIRWIHSVYDQLKDVI